MVGGRAGVGRLPKQHRRVAAHIRSAPGLTTTRLEFPVKTKNRVVMVATKIATATSLPVSVLKSSSAIL